MTHWSAGMDGTGPTVSQYVLLHTHAPLLSSAHGTSAWADAMWSSAMNQEVCVFWHSAAHCLRAVFARLSSMAQ